MRPVMTRKELNYMLFRAVKDGDIISVKRAIEWGADVNGVATPLDIANLNGPANELYDLIRKHGGRRAPLNYQVNYQEK